MLVLLSLSLRSKYFPQHPALKHLQSMFFSLVWETKFERHIKQQHTPLKPLLRYFRNLTSTITNLWTVCYYAAYFVRASSRMSQIVSVKCGNSCHYEGFDELRLPSCKVITVNQIPLHLLHGQTKACNIELISDTETRSRQDLLIKHFNAALETVVLRMENQKHMQLLTLFTWCARYLASTLWSF
jgi:hypothetical protein